MDDVPARSRAARRRWNREHRARREAYEAARAAYLAAYEQTVRRNGPALLPADIDLPLAALEIEKASYEVLYELNNRPDWLPIPLAALHAS